MTLFDGVPRAPFTASAKQVTPVGATISASASVGLDSLPPAGGRVVPDILLSLTQVGTVRGVVRTPEGAGVASARVSLAAGSLSILDFANAEGAFEFVGVPLDVPLRLTALAPNGDLGVFLGRIDTDGTVRDRTGAALVSVTLLLDVEPPTVVSLTPASGAIAVGTDTTVTVRFSEAIDPATVRVCTGVPTTTRPSIRLVESTGELPALNDPDDPCDDSNIVPVTAAVSADGLTVTLTPKAALRGTTQHAISVTGGEIGGDGNRSGGIQDLIGRPLGTEFLAAFVTRDNVPPRVLFVSPANGNANIAADSLVRITLPEPIAVSSVTAASISVTGPNGLVDGRRDLILGNTVVVFTPVDGSVNRAYLTANAIYTVRVAGVADMTGNPLPAANAVVASFRTLDTVPLTVTSIGAPIEARAGEKVVVSAFSNDADVRSVEFFIDGVVAAVAQVLFAPGEYRAEITMPARTISVTARPIDTSGNVGAMSQARTIQLLDRQPAISSVLPSSAPQGETVTITVTGTDTHFQQGVSQVSLGAGLSVADVVVSGPTLVSATVTIPENAGTGQRAVTVTTGNEVASLAAFTVTAGVPVLLSVTPSNAVRGQTVTATVLGRFTNFLAATPSVSFGSGVTVNSVTVNSATSLSASVTVGLNTAIGPLNITVVPEGSPAASVLVNGDFEAPPVLGAGQSEVIAGSAKWTTTGPGGPAYESSISGIREWTYATLRAIIIAMLDTCCRPGELLSLEWSDVDLEQRQITIRAEKTKTRHGRLLPISSRLLSTLQMRRLGPDGKDLPPEAFVFGDEVGNEARSIRTTWENARSAAGLSGFHLADLRHEAASRFEEAGVPTTYVSKFLGHGSLSTTTRYLNATTRGLRLALDKLEETRNRSARKARKKRSRGQNSESLASGLQAPARTSARTHARGDEPSSPKPLVSSYLARVQLRWLCPAAPLRRDSLRQSVACQAVAHPR